MIADKHLHCNQTFLVHLLIK